MDGLFERVIAILAVLAALVSVSTAVAVSIKIIRALWM